MSDQGLVLDQSAGNIFGRGPKDNRLSEDVLDLHKRTATLELAVGNLQQHDSHFSEALARIKADLNNTDETCELDKRHIETTDNHTHQNQRDITELFKHVHENQRDISEISKHLLNLSQILVDNKACSRNNQM